MKAANQDNADKMRSNYLNAENINRELRMYDWAAVVIIEVQHNHLKNYVFGCTAAEGPQPLRHLAQ